MEWPFGWSNTGLQIWVIIQQTCDVLIQMKKTQSDMSQTFCFGLQLANSCLNSAFIQKYYSDHQEARHPNIICLTTIFGIYSILIFISPFHRISHESGNLEKLIFYNPNHHLINTHDNIYTLQCASPSNGNENSQKKPVWFIVLYVLNIVEIITVKFHYDTIPVIPWLVLYYLISLLSASLKIF